MFFNVNTLNTNIKLGVLYRPITWNHNNPVFVDFLSNTSMWQTVEGRMNI